MKILILRTDSGNNALVEAIPHISSSMNSTFADGGAWSFPETTTKATFSLDKTRAEFEAKANKYAKFKQLERKPFLLKYDDPCVHAGVPKEEPISEQQEPLMSTHQASFGIGRKPTLTELNMYYTSHAPPARGRSGPRMEKGMQTSGLLGERYYTGDDLAKNNFVQRSWLYTPDPSLTYKKYGVPEADPSQFTGSLQLESNGDNAKDYDPDARFARTSEITNTHALTKRGPSVFQDEDEFCIRKYPAPYPDTMLRYDSMKYDFYRTKAFMAESILNGTAKKHSR